MEVLEIVEWKGGVILNLLFFGFVGFLGYLHLIRGMPASELDETVFKNRVFIENYLDYLRVSNLSLY